MSKALPQLPVVKELETKNFRVNLCNPKEKVEDFISDDVHKYTWMVGTAGELVIYRVTYHKQLYKAKMSEDRIKCYNANQWNTVEVLEDKGEVNEDTVGGDPGMLAAM